MSILREQYPLIFSLLLLMMYFSVLVLFGTLVSVFRQKAGKCLKVAVAVLLALVCALWWSVMSESYYAHRILPFSLSMWSSSIWAAVFAALSLVIFAVSLWLVFYMHHWRDTHISADSIHEGIDRLPAGVCYYWPLGAVKLANYRIRTLCRMLTGKGLLNGRVFMERISTSDRRIPGTKALILSMPDGSVVSFSQREILFEGRKLFEVLAYDVTEECRLTAELTQLQKREKEINQRLRALSGEIKYMIMEKERLDMRARIHDQIGHVLLHSRRILASRGRMSPEEVRTEWERISHMLTLDKPDVQRAPWEAFEERARALGIRLVIAGAVSEVPQKFLPLLDQAVSVHLTNVMRHAEGNEARMELRNMEGFLTVCFTNNGTPPQEKVMEAGGLRNLRTSVEQKGGTMLLSSFPVFALEIKLPLEEDADAL